MSDQATRTGRGRTEAPHARGPSGSADDRAPSSGEPGEAGAQAFVEKGGLVSRLAAAFDEGPLESSLARAAGVLVDELGDLCTVDLLDEDRALRRVAWAASGEERRRTVVELLERYPPDQGRAPLLAKIVEQQAVVVESEIPDGHLSRVAQDELHLGLIRALRLRSSAAVPLASRGAVLGVLRVSSAEPRRYGAAVVAQLVEAGRALGLAIEAARHGAAEAKARASAEAARDRLRFLEAASAALSTTRDVELAVAEVARLAAAAVADWCVVDLLEDGVLRRAALAFDPRSPDRDRIEREGWEFVRSDPLDPDAPVGEAAVIRGGTAILVPSITDEMLASYAASDAHLAFLRRVAPSSTILAPIRADGAPFGCVALTRRAGRPPFSDDDLAMALDLAARLGWALENARAQREAKSAAFERDELMTLVGHELKTPLAALRIGLEVLNRQVAPAMPSAGEQVARLKRQIVRVSALVDQLVDDARLASGRVELDREEIDLAELVAEVARALEHVTAEVECSLVVRAPEPVLVLADRRRLEQVVTNLVANACKYAPGSTIEVSVTSTAAEATLCVRDSGPGIEEEMLSRVFDRFQRGERHEGTPGLGLGLWLVKTVAEAHGGSVDVESAAGSGAAFLVRLPRGA